MGSVAVLALIMVVALAARDETIFGGTTQAESSTPLRIGYVPYWDQERGLDSVEEHFSSLDEVSPVWYTLEANGDVVLADSEYTTVDPDAVQDMQERGIRVIPTVTNLREGDWDPDVAREMLLNPEAVERHVDGLVELAVDRGYDGLDIDYESLRADTRDAFSGFLRDLRDGLHAEGKILSVDVHPKTSDAGDDERNQAQDYAAIGEIADQVRIMTYDHSWETSPPGPVAPAEWVEEVVTWAVGEIPPEKIILGIVLLGYDWSEGRGVTVDYGQAQERAQEHGATVQRSEDGSPWFRYESDDGTAHEVWFEDAVSARVKLDLVRRYDLGGVFLWRLGGEDPGVWQSVRAGLGP